MTWCEWLGGNVTTWCLVAIDCIRISYSADGGHQGGVTRVKSAGGKTARHMVVTWSWRIVRNHAGKKLEMNLVTVRHELVILWRAAKHILALTNYQKPRDLAFLSFSYLKAVEVRESSRSVCLSVKNRQHISDATGNVTTQPLTPCHKNGPGNAIEK